MSYDRNPRLRYRTKSYPLPWAWNWCTGQNGNGSGTTYPEPAYIKTLVDAGRRVIPVVELNGATAQDTWAEISAYAQPAFETCRDYGLPVVFVADNIFDSFKIFTEFSSQTSTVDLDSHAWFAKDDGVNPISLSSSQVSPFARMLGPWCERLGYLYGSSAVVQNAISIYPTPPCVYLFDNNETGWDADNQYIAGFREPREPVNLANYLDWYDANIGSYSGIEADLHTDYRNRILSSVFADQQRFGKYRFQRGFYKALAETSEHWASVAVYTPYGQNRAQWSNDQVYNVWGTGEPKITSFGKGNWNPGFVSGRGGKTGESYINDWYPDYREHLRVWSVLISQEWNKRVSEYINGTVSLDSICLLWEGNTNASLEQPPPRSVWGNMVRTAMWLGRCNLVGHFMESNTQITWSKNTVYYDEVINACDEVAKPTLVDFWKHGELVDSVEPHPSPVQHTVEWMEEEPWPMQHIRDVRFDPDVRSDPLYATTTPVDELRRYLGSVGRYGDYTKELDQNNRYLSRLCFAIKLGTDYLIFSGKTNTTDSVDLVIWLNVNNAIHEVTVPFSSEGSWTIYDSVGLTTTAYDPDTETPIPWRPWKDTSTVLDVQRKAELDARKQKIADVIEYTQSTAAATPAPLSAPEQAAADTAKQTATNYINYIDQGS